VCIRRFAPGGWSRAAVLGCGEQGNYHARVLAALNPDVVIRAYDPDPSRTLQVSAQVESVDDPQSAVAGAEIVVTAGPIVEAPTPVISGDWLESARVVLPIDFDFYVRREAIETADALVVDDVDQFEYYRGRGHFEGWPAPDATVGEAVVRDLRPGQVACVNLGVGSLDAAFASEILRAAGERVGTRISL
jgi:ornithine cyclodeaminase/alanine dehydrogenase-like protein (mu-crystallin family)